MAVRPLRPAKDHQLGELLPHQQPNPTKAHLKAAFSLYKYLVFFINNLKNNNKIIPNFKVDSYVLLTRSPCLKHLTSMCKVYC